MYGAQEFSTAVQKIRAEEIAGAEKNEIPLKNPILIPMRLESGKGTRILIPSEKGGMS